MEGFKNIYTAQPIKNYCWGLSTVKTITTNKKITINTKIKAQSSKLTHFQQSSFNKMMMMRKKNINATR